jgi:C-terminal processing protease CtpA/Prc
MEQYGGERAVVLQPNSYGSQTNSYFSQPSSGSRVASPLLHPEFQETFLLRQSGGSPSLSYPQQQPVMFVQQQPVMYQPMITTTRRLCGIGCVIERNSENQCVVAKVLSGGASDGLVFVGDIIDEVDNVPTDRIPVAETPQRFMGEVGSFVNLGVVSRSTGRRVVTIQRRSINALNSSYPSSPSSPSPSYAQQQPVMYVQQHPVMFVQQQPMVTTTRRVCGIGCVIERNRENQCVVAKVLPGGASDGLVFVGDIIDEVDNVPTDRIPVAETPQRFMGEVGSFVNLGVVSRSTGRRVVTIQRRSINALNSSYPTSAYRSTVRSTSPYSVRSASPSARSVLRQSSYNTPTRPEPAPACTVS